jgi:hypothetical protein
MAPLRARGTDWVKSVWRRRRDWNGQGGHDVSWNEEPVHDQASGIIDWRAYEKELMDLCQSKAEEFHLLGYTQVTAEEVWHCARVQVNGEQPLHRIVEAILGLQIGQFMNYATLSAYKGLLDDAETAALGLWFDDGKRG